MKRAFAFAALVMTTCVTAVMVAAPQLPHLLVEGFAPAIDAGSGPYVTVVGVAARDTAVVPPILDPDALALFAASDGTAMLMDQAGTLTGAHYAPGIEQDTRLNSYSMVKTLVGVLTLRAIADGVILPETTVQATADLDITVAQLLTMSGGLAATNASTKRTHDEAYSPFSALGRMHVYGVEDAAPGLRIRPDWQGSFHYQSANTALLGRLLEQAYDMPLSDLLSQTIWRPAGAADATWRYYPRGEGITAYCCLYARPVDWLRVGRYLLDNGTPDAPLLPPRMWQDWIQPDLPADLRRAGVYGQHIRHDVLDREGAATTGPFAYAMGHEGQVMYLLPDYDTVVVRFGGAPQLLHSTLYTLLAPNE